MSLADLIRGTPKRDSGGVATLTVATPATVADPSAPSVATVASVTVATAEERESKAVAASLWLLHFSDPGPMVVAFSPAVDRAGVLAAYPAAMAFEPLTEPPAVSVPADLATLFDACELVGLCDDHDRAALPAMFALDPDGTRGLIEVMHSRIGRCRRCRHFRRPGLSDGYCVRRADLRHVYGAMRALPSDAGTHCRMFDPGGGVNLCRLSVKTALYPSSTQIATFAPCARAGASVHRAPSTGQSKVANK